VVLIVNKPWAKMFSYNMAGESRRKNGVVTYRMNSFQALVHKGIGWKIFKLIGSKRVATKKG